MVPVDSLKALDDDFDGLSGRSSGGKFKQAVKEARHLLGKDPKPEKTEKTTSQRSNDIIFIDPETGEQKMKKKRGRPPKKRPEDAPPPAPAAVLQYGHKKTNLKEAKLIKTAQMGRLRRRLQKILLRPEIKPKELPLAEEIINLLFTQKRCTIDQLDVCRIYYFYSFI